MPEAETWRTVIGFPDYTASNWGYIRGPKRTLTPVIDRDGYGRVTPYLNGKAASPKGVHRLVCEAFHGPAPEGKPHAAHRDGDKSNNIASNLYWASPSENEQDKVRHGGNPQARKTHCPQGHEYAGENLIANPSGRQCRKCKQVRELAYQAANRDKANEKNRRYRARLKEKASQ